MRKAVSARRNHLRANAKHSFGEAVSGPAVHAAGDRDDNSFLKIRIRGSFAPSVSIAATFSGPGLFIVAGLENRKNAIGMDRGD
jgi:hypothetical protein